MNLYRISQKVNDNPDTYDGAIVCAESEIEARFTHPSSSELINWYSGDWTKPENVEVQLIGVAGNDIEKGVICASFNRQ